MLSQDNNTLYALTLILTPTAAASLSATMGHQAHGAFLATIRQVDPVLAEALHAEGVRVRPFTVSPLLDTPPARNGQLVLAPGAAYGLRLTLLSAPLYERFMARFLQGEGRPLIRLGTAEFLLREIRTTPGSHPWAGYTTWAQLAQAAPAGEITLEFATPTAFGFGQMPWGKKVVVLPEPELVFGSLARSWNALAPPGLEMAWPPLDGYLRKHVVLKRIAGLETQMQHFGRSPQVGFVGRVTYGLMGADDTLRRQLAALASFAFYAGVGMKTTMGMGQCRLITTGSGR